MANYYIKGGLIRQEIRTIQSKASIKSYTLYTVQSVKIEIGDINGCYSGRKAHTLNTTDEYLSLGNRFTKRIQ